MVVESSPTTTRDRGQDRGGQAGGGQVNGVMGDLDLGLCRMPGSSSSPRMALTW